MFMDETTFSIFDEKGTDGVRKGRDTAYEVVERAFETAAEMDAYIQALHDITWGCWSHYAVLDKTINQ